MIFQFALIFPLLTFWFSFCLMLLIIQFLLLLRRTVRQSVSPKLFNLFVCLEYIEMFPSLGGRSRPALTLGQQQLLFGDHPTKSWTLMVGCSSKTTTKLWFLPLFECCPRFVSSPSSHRLPFLLILSAYAYKKKKNMKIGKIEKKKRYE